MFYFGLTFALWIGFWQIINNVINGYLHVHQEGLVFKGQNGFVGIVSVTYLLGPNEIIIWTPDSCVSTSTFLIYSFCKSLLMPPCARCGFGARDVLWTRRTWPCRDLWLTNCGPQPCSDSITCELGRNSAAQAPLQTYWIHFNKITRSCLLL